jgi:SAM-dependent methyltransferase
MSEPLYFHDQLTRRSEAWRPRQFKTIRTRSDRIAAAFRRFLDLQAGSIWRDLSRLVPRFRGVVLDVGCGAQPYRALVHPDAVYQAIDYSGALEHFGYRAPDTTYFQGYRWPISDASVDAVLCTETLEHVPEPRAFLAEAFRCLKPGGSILLTVPFAARWHYIPHDYWRFTPSGLERLLRKAGFIGMTVFARGNALTVACYKVMALLIPWLMPQHNKLGVRLLAQSVGLLTIPLLVFLAFFANLSLAARGGDDCLGYTAIAARPDLARSPGRENRTVPSE